MAEMKRHRGWLAATFCWFLLLAAVLPLSGVPHAYPYVLAWSFLFLLSPTVRGLPLWLLAGSASVIFVVTQSFGSWTTDISLVLPVVAIFISLLIAKALGDSDDALERTVRFRMNEGRSEPGSVGSIQRSLQIELQRARSHKRPLSVLAISTVDLDDTEVGSLAGLLSDEMRAFDLLGARRDHFVSMLPETNWENAAQFATRLRAKTREQLGIELEIGLSSFPAQITLEAMLQHAESDMRANDKPMVDTTVELGQREGSWSG